MMRHPEDLAPVPDGRLGGWTDGLTEIAVGAVVLLLLAFVVLLLLGNVERIKRDRRR